MSFDVSVAACETYAPDDCRRALEQALAPLGGLDWIRPGMRVAIKANLITAMKPDTAAVTHPALLAALTAMLKTRGASVVVGDSPGGLYNAVYLDRVYSAAGLSAVEAAGGALNRNFAQRTADYPDGKICRRFPYTSYLDDADVIIDFCKLKTHGMMGMSAATKNLFGVIPGTVKPEFHFQYPNAADFARMLVDVAEFVAPRLSICDAVMCMEGNGPTAGTPRHMGLVLVGSSPHRLDLVCAALMGLGKRDVPTLEAAFERGLIPEAVESLSISGDWRPFIAEDYKTITVRSDLLFGGSGGNLLLKLRGAAAQKALCSRPKVHKPQCIGCAKCHNVCPAKAITMQKKLPIINKKACIRCFCCQEFCPTGAMKVHRPLPAKLLNR